MNPFADAAKAAMHFLKPKDEAQHIPDPEEIGAVVSSTVPSLDAVLTQRGKRYGTFKSNSIVYDNLMYVFQESPNWATAPPEVRHACGNIATKLARLLAGDVMYDDNWTDIAGYATLMAKICRGEAS